MAIFSGKTFWTPVPTPRWISPSSLLICSLDCSCPTLTPTAANSLLVWLFTGWDLTPHKPEQCAAPRCSCSAKHCVHSQGLWMDKWVNKWNWGDHPGLPRWVPCIHKDLYKKERLEWCGHKPRNAAASKNWKRQEMNSPQEPPEETRPSDPLILALYDSFLDFWPPEL